MVDLVGNMVDLLDKNNNSLFVEFYNTLDTRSQWSWHKDDIVRTSDFVDGVFDDLDLFVDNMKGSLQFVNLLQNNWFLLFRQGWDAVFELFDCFMNHRDFNCELFDGFLENLNDSLRSSWSDNWSENGWVQRISDSDDLVLDDMDLSADNLDLSSQNSDLLSDNWSWFHSDQMDKVLVSFVEDNSQFLDLFLEDMNNLFDDRSDWSSRSVNWFFDLDCGSWDLRSSERSDDVQARVHLSSTLSADLLLDVDLGASIVGAVEVGTWIAGASLSQDSEGLLALLVNNSLLSANLEDFLHDIQDWFDAAGDSSWNLMDASWEGSWNQRMSWVNNSWGNDSWDQRMSWVDNSWGDDSWDQRMSWVDNSWSDNRGDWSNKFDSPDCSLNVDDLLSNSDEGLFHGNNLFVDNWSLRDWSLWENGDQVSESSSNSSDLSNQFARSFLESDDDLLVFGSQRSDWKSDDRLVRVRILNVDDISLSSLNVSDDLSDCFSDNDGLFNNWWSLGLWNIVQVIFEVMKLSVEWSKLVVPVFDLNMELMNNVLLDWGENCWLDSDWLHWVWVLNVIEVLG